MESGVFCQPCMKVMLITVLLTTTIAEAVPSADLVSSPDLSSLSGGGLCPGPILLTCTVTELPFSIWKTGGSELVRYNPSERDSLEVPFALPLDIPRPGVQLEVTRVMQVAAMSDNFNMGSTLTANASVMVKNFAGRSIQCGTSNKTSNSIPINFHVIETPPLLPRTNCSLVASTGGVEMTFQWPSAFNSNYTVGRYRVTVTPDPSSCSSDQVPPSDNYSCSGLDPDSDYSITVSAINCGDQEGEPVSFDVQPQLLAPEPPQNVTVLSDFNSRGLTISVFWKESAGVSENCSFWGAVNYNLTLEDIIAVPRMVGSERCNNGSCSFTMSTSSTICNFNVRIAAINIFGSSNEVITPNKVPSRLTSTNTALLVLGVVLWCVTLVVGVISVVLIKMRCKQQRISLILLLPGGFWLVVTVALWLTVGFRVGLQENTCDVNWQKNRDGIIISTLSISVVSLMVMALLIAVTYRLHVKGEDKTETSMREEGKPESMSLQSSWWRQKFSSGQHQQSESSDVLEYKFKPLCTAIWKHRKLCQVMNHASCPEGVAEWFPKCRRWKEADLAVDKLLAVTLMNECPTEWKYNDNVINHKLFMELVNDTWRNKFILGAQDASHIHVLFKGDSEGSWSALGSSAKFINNAHISHPTMVLNFSNMNSEEIKATIAHQFGHAMGLGHALMRPEKWEGLKPYLNVDKMMKHHGSPSLEDFEVMWTGKGMKCDDINYDDESIMRYTASASWVNEEKTSFRSRKLNAFRGLARKLNCQPTDDDLKAVIERRPPISIAHLLRLENKSAGVKIRVTEALADDWEVIAKKFLMKKETQTLIASSDICGNNVERLKYVWNLWLNKSDELLHKKKYPPSWESFRILLKDIGRHQTAKEFFEVLNQLYIA